jgi:glycosyltransferase involved in cell wall biosynthesis
LCAKPYILIVYDVYPDIVVKLGVLRANSPLVWSWERIARLILRGAEAIVVIGRDMAKKVGEKLHPAYHGRLHLIPNWSDERTVYPVPSASNTFRREQRLEGKFIVQYAGRMARTHNLEPLLDAAEILAGREVLFQFIGDGANKKRLMNIARERNLNNVQFLPYQPLARLAEVLSAADLSVVSLESMFTGLSVPSKAYGVMASGRPILALLDKESEIGQTIIENNCGVVLPDPDGRQVAEVIRGLIDDPERLRGMGDNGRKAFLEKYSLRTSAQKYSALMERCFSQPW